MLHIISSHKTPIIWRTGSFGLYWMVYSIWPFGPSSISTAPLFPLKPEKMVVPTGVSWKKRKKDNNILCLLKKNTQLSVSPSQFTLWSCQVLTFSSPSISSYPAYFLVLSGSRAPLWWQRLACCSPLYSPSQTDGQGWEKKRKKAFVRTWSAAWCWVPLRSEQRK